MAYREHRRSLIDAMMVFVVRRVLHACAVVLTATTLGFAVLRLAPGDGVSGETSQVGRSADARARVRTARGLDQSVVAQYARFLGNAARGDLGRSQSDNQLVTTTLSDALRNSIVLSGCGLLAAVTLGLCVGIAQGWSPEWRTARVIGTGLTALYTMPEFVLAIVVIGALAYAAPLFPIGGISDPIVRLTGSSISQVIDILRHLVLPVLTLALGWGAAIARQERVALREISREEFLRTARAKGVRPRALLLRHAVRPSLPAVATIFAMMLPSLVGGAVVVEVVFAWPGMGTLLLHAVAQRDAPIVAGAIIVIATMVSASSLTLELLLRVIDPRLRELA